MVTMTCADAASHVDGFVDGELPPAVSIDVARHLSQCRRCDTAVQNLLALRDALVSEADRAVASLDLSGVWAQVDRTITHAAEQGAWRERAAARRRVPRAVAWGTVAAIAAAAALFLRPVGDAGRPLNRRGRAPGRRRASASACRTTCIDRLAGRTSRAEGERRP
jgi:anti-sigma factor RsiW